MGHKDYEVIHVWTFEDDKFLRISSKLLIDAKKELVKFLKRNVDLFAWKPKDMPSISPNIIAHELNVDYMKKLV